MNRRSFLKNVSTLGLSAILAKIAPPIDFTEPKALLDEAIDKGDEIIEQQSQYIVGTSQMIFMPHITTLGVEAPIYFAPSLPTNQTEYENETNR